MQCGKCALIYHDFGQVIQNSGTYKAHEN